MRDEDINKLCKQTSFSYRKCRKALIEHHGDYEAALRQLSEMKQNRFVVAWDNLKSFFIGENGVKLSMYDQERVLLTIPAIFPVLFMFIFRVPSWLIASIIVLMVLFGMDMKIESIIKRKKTGIEAVSVQDYKKSKTASERVVYDSRTGYYEYTVE